MSRVLSVLIRRARSHAQCLQYREHSRLHSLSMRTMVDRSFRLANVGDLAVAQDFKDKHFVSPEHFVSFMHTADVSTRDLSKQLVIDLSHPQGYKRGHIKGAVNLPLEKFDFTRLIDNQKVGGITQDEVYAVFKALGVGNDTSEIILYDNSGLLASRLWFVLRYFGFTNVRVLNGGWRSWLRAGLPVEEAEVSAVAATSLDLKAKRESIVTSPSAMLFAHEKGHAQIIDTRRSEAFQTYHIPRALSVPSSSLMMDGEFASVQQIRETLAAKGVRVAGVRGGGSGGRQDEQAHPEVLHHEFLHHEPNADTDAAAITVPPSIVYSSKGLTSAVVYFCLGMAGVDDVSVYDEGIFNWMSNFEKSKLDPDIAEELGR